MYDRQITPDQALTFGVSGMLYRNGLIMFDRQTDSLWSHILGQAIAGDYKGASLTFIPALQTDWQSWKTLHPETVVVKPELVGGDSYSFYYASGQEGVLGWANRNNSLPPKEYVIGVRLAGQAKAYPFSVLDRQPVVNDQVGGVDIVVFFDQATASGAVFDRRLADETILEFAPSSAPRLALDNQTKSEWDILSGKATGGPLAGAQLAQVPITYAFWFGWVDYHGQSSVYTLNE